jgi:7,8-dihydroneopterin aldolase/epimerase/oxygenase
MDWHKLNSTMLSIHLKQVRFFAYHGIFEEEKRLGNEYEVDIKIQCSSTGVIIQHLHQTIDYSLVYSMLKERMQQPTALLETIASEFSHLILKTFPMADLIVFEIHKMYPPIEAMVGQVGVVFELNRSQL